MNVEFFLQILKERFLQISSLLQMDLARASLGLLRVLRTLINSIAKNLHKLQICLRFYSFHKKLNLNSYCNYSKRFYFVNSNKSY